MYVRAQVEVTMAGWTTDEMRALPGMYGLLDDGLLMYHEYARKIPLLRMRAINVNALSNYNVNIWIVLYTARMRTRLFGSDPASVNLDPIWIEVNPDYSASVEHL